MFSVFGTASGIKTTTGGILQNTIAYDANGNFMNLNRNMGANQSAKNLNFSYYSGTNRLRNTDGSSINKYQYDAAGNVITNSERNINSITYDHRNLAQRIETDNSGTHRYIYDHTGTRVGKQYKPHGATNWSVNTRYIYGAHGEMLAQYDGASPQYWNILAGEETIGRRHAGRVIRGQVRAYYLKDHLGSVRVTVTEDGTVLGWDDYYPFGLQMPGRSSNSADTHDDLKFTGHFLEQEGDLGVYHARARMYDPETGRFWGVDAMRGMYPNLGSYTYVANNPIKYIDPDGNHIVVAKNEDGTYTVVDGELNDDTSIYIQHDGEGPMDLLGQMITTHSFFNEDDNVVVDAIIDMNSNEGQNFLDDEIIDADPSLYTYIFTEDGGGPGNFLDFKVRGGADDLNKYRGSVAADGKVGSARDFGNIGAGFVAGRKGIPYSFASKAFDHVQRGPEPPVSAKAQKLGHQMGADHLIQRTVSRVPQNSSGAK